MLLLCSQHWASMMKRLEDFTWDLYSLLGHSVDIRPGAKDFPKLKFPLYETGVVCWFFGK